MKRILIAFDGSPGAEAALLDMVRAGLPEKCEAKVLSIADVWLPLESAQPDMANPDPARASRAEARERALAAIASARATAAHGAERLRSLFPGWSIQAIAEPESPAWGVLAAARHWPADLVVIGSHGRSPLQKFFLGSVSFKVAAEANCSVRVFKAHHRPADHSVRVLLALDGSSDSDNAFREVLERRWPGDTKFALVTVIDEKVRAAEFADSFFFPAKMDSRADDTLAKVLSERAELFRKRRFEVSTHIFEGDPKAELLRYAAEWESDCIFLGARGLQHRERLYLGTLASAVLTRAHCTVEVCRPQPRPITE